MPWNRRSIARRCGARKQRLLRSVPAVGSITVTTLLAHCRARHSGPAPVCRLSGSRFVQLRQWQDAWDTRELGPVALAAAQVRAVRYMLHAGGNATQPGAAGPYLRLRAAGKKPTRSSRHAQATHHA